MVNGEGANTGTGEKRPTSEVAICIDSSNQALGRVIDFDRLEEAFWRFVNEAIDAESKKGILGLDQLIVFFDSGELSGGSIAEIHPCDRRGHSDQSAELIERLGGLGMAKQQLEDRSILVISLPKVYQNALADSKLELSLETIRLEYTSLVSKLDIGQKEKLDQWFEFTDQHAASKNLDYNEYVSGGMSQAEATADAAGLEGNNRTQFFGICEKYIMANSGYISEQDALNFDGWLNKALIEGVVDSARIKIEIERKRRLSRLVEWMMGREGRESRVAVMPISLKYKEEHKDDSEEGDPIGQADLGGVVICLRVGHPRLTKSDG
ncbi:hypothetical protein H6792_00275 [Candidatus Nomurabacteria bacterium]|nr:hypothetical protein [Candidatus Nomurabacteria bacterium]